MKTQLKKLKKLHPCGEAVVFVGKFETLQEAWNKCERGDWMLWLLGKMSGGPRSKSRKEVVLIACQCARLSLKYVPKGEKRPLIAIETAEKWVKGEATLQQVRDAAYADADAAYAYADAAYAAAYAAAAAAAADDAYAYAAYAAYAATYADADRYAYAAAAVDDAGYWVKRYEELKHRVAAWSRKG